MSQGRAKGNLVDENGDALGNATNPLRNDPTGTTAQPITAASLPLPAGAATETTLAAVNTATGTTADADTANTVIGRLKQIITKLAGGLPAALVGGRLDSNIGAWLGSTAPTVGQKTAANSLPNVVASDQWPDALARSIFIKATDGTNTAAVKAASTPAALTDPALVVTQSPNSLARIVDSNGKPLRSTVAQELKIAGLFTLADLTNKYELDTRLWDSLTATGGTTAHVAAQSALRCSVTGTSGSSAALCTNTFYKYQAGYTQLITLSIIHADAGQTNQVREWGYFDTANGLFWRLSGTTLSIVERSSTSGSPVDTVIAQTSWNVDKFNGTGASGVTIDLTKGNLFEIEVQWFGVGTVRYFCNGVLLHEASHANTLAVPYMTTAQLPVQMRIVNSGASVASSITMVCARVAAQAQQHDPQEWLYGAFTPSDLLVGVSEVPVLTIRPKSTYNSITNRMWLLPRSLTISTEGYALSYKVIANVTLTGASFTSVATGSGAEFDTAATAYSGGELLYRDFIGDKEAGDHTDLSGLFNVFGRMLRQPGFAGSGVNVVDSLTIVAMCEAVGRTRARANLTWAEIR